MRSLWIAVTVWIGVILFSSTSTASRWCESAFSYLSEIFMAGMPQESGSYGAVHLVADKGLHVTLFAVLGILLCGAIASPRAKVAKVLCFGLVVGSCSEYLQSFFPDRDPALRDVFINLTGTALGALLSRMYRGAPSAGAREDLREYTFSGSDGH